MREFARRPALQALGRRRQLDELFHPGGRTLMVTTLQVGLMPPAD
jgi:hypothetical protein